MPLRILGTSGQGFAAYAAAGAVMALIGCTGKVTREPVEHFRVVAPGRLSAGARVNEEGLRWLQERGIRTILNLERELLETVPGEVRKERARAQALGLSFIHFPLHPVTAPTLNQLDEAVRIIANTHDQVFVHCDHGIERTGMVVAAYRIKERGWSVERAYKDMLESGFHLHLYFWWKHRLDEFSNLIKTGQVTSPRGAHERHT